MAGSVKIIGGSKKPTHDLTIAQFVLTTTTLLTVELQRAQNFWAFGSRPGSGSGFPKIWL